MSRAPRQWPPSVQKALWCWPIAMPGQWGEAALGQPREGPEQGVTSSDTLMWTPTCHCPLWVCEDGPLMAWWLLWWSWAKARHDLGSPTWLCAALWVYRRARCNNYNWLIVMFPSALLSKVRDCTCDFYLFISNWFYFLLHKHLSQKRSRAGSFSIC